MYSVLDILYLNKSQLLQILIKIQYWYTKLFVLKRSIRFYRLKINQPKSVLISAIITHFSWSLQENTQQYNGTISFKKSAWTG